jgi:uncharacterized protein YwbE
MSIGAKVGSGKKQAQKIRKLGEKVVKMVLYNGRNIGHGKYFVGEVDGKLVEDANGKPVPFREIGELVWDIPVKK